MLFYDPPLMETLARRPGISFVDFPRFLDSYVQSPLERVPRSRLADDYRRFQRFYFQQNPDSGRLARLQAALRAAGVPVDSLAASYGSE